MAEPVLTEIVIHVSDQHTVLNTQGKNKPALPLGSEQGYTALHRRIASDPRHFLNYRQVRNVAPVVLDQLRRGYLDEKFWHRFVKDSFDKYPDHSWHQFLPLAASLSTQLDFDKSGWAFEIKPTTRVVIYPFGWSTRLSLRILGRLSLANLADVVNRLFNSPCIKVQGAANSVQLEQWLYQVADGLRQDAFAGTRTNDIVGRDLLMVITVLAKYNSSPPAIPATSDAQDTMLRLVRPTTRPSGTPYAQRVRYLLPGDQFQYALVEDRNYFMWIQALLQPMGRNRDKLLCYHNNTVESLERAGHLQALVANAVEPRTSVSTRDLAQLAAAELRIPLYKGPLVTDFTASPAVTNALNLFGN